ncbi:MAG: choice-of-anchor Q domain-containing protein [Candidatus Pseudobacter hemicellulosilyticus]|uniref:Choice-of-anchor Q domain-containing protein n=1 Tax=Candidatus Pseudobacter hemicellulosilyticus TaxID=3121375 RepID=A0AAJ5WVB5_9BACT|nr:MAG: choice-of-anchor Q domain-containing protein [Pseudobacter sp.]
MKHILVLVLLAGCILPSCRKQSFITGNAGLGTSADTLHFDTVFTTIGSVTQVFKILNQNEQKLRLRQVSLGGGNSSFFRINVDGLTGPAVNNLEMEANDSLYVFVSVRIDPSSANLPFVIRDSIHIQYNEQEQWVQLEAWGQNAHFLRKPVISQDQTWTSTLPYVILGALQVDTGVTLSIQKGARIYAHADAPFIVDGTLLVQGEAGEGNQVSFLSDRLDEPYRDFPAGWPGLVFRGSSQDNLLRFAHIKNAYQGIAAEHPSISMNPRVKLEQCIIDNCYDAGILGINTVIEATNCLISNCGKNIQLVFGGHYVFNHCTVAAYSNAYIQHKEPVLFAGDYLRQGNGVYTADLNAFFSNCIFWGDNGTVDNEVMTQKEGNGAFNVVFDNCLWKVKTVPANTVVNNTIVNIAPAFDSIDNQQRYYNFRLKEGSEGIDKGAASGAGIDLDGLPRPVGLPDIGCYEKQ